MTTPRRRGAVAPAVALLAAEIAMLVTVVLMVAMARIG